MKIGYARVSTREQSFDLQLDALRQAGCERIHRETVSGAQAIRPQLDLMLDHRRAGDVLIIWKLDRLGRSLRHLVELVHALQKKGWDSKASMTPLIPRPRQGASVSISSPPSRSSSAISSGSARRPGSPPHGRGAGAVAGPAGCPPAPKSRRARPRPCCSSGSGSREAGGCQLTV
jgi:hypothetical protein